LRILPSTSCSYPSRWGARSRPPFQLVSTHAGRETASQARIRRTWDVPTGMQQETGAPHAGSESIIASLPNCAMPLAYHKMLKQKTPQCLGAVRKCMSGTEEALLPGSALEAPILDQASPRASRRRRSELTARADQRKLQPTLLRTASGGRFAVDSDPTRRADRPHSFACAPKQERRCRADCGPR
jgi:hypothetical protein